MRVEGIKAKPKEWSWSYSKLKNFRTCPKRHYEIDLAKNYTDSGEGMVAGNLVHKALADACVGKVPLTKEYSYLQEWVDRVQRGPGELFVEQKYAITRDFKPTAFFARDAWYRGIADVVRIDRDIALAIDWKTGKVLDDPIQLMLTACCLFVHYPALKRVRSEYVWLKEGSTTPEVFDRNEVAAAVSALLPEVDLYEKAVKAETFPPKANGLCMKYCMVTSCIHHGKGARGR